MFSSNSSKQNNFKLIYFKRDYNEASLSNTAVTGALQAYYYKTQNFTTYTIFYVAKRFFLKFYTTGRRGVT